MPSSGLVSQHLLLKVKNYTRGCFLPHLKRRRESEGEAVNFAVHVWWFLILRMFSLVWFCLLALQGVVVGVFSAQCKN